MNIPAHAALSEDIEDAVSIQAAVCGCPHIHLLLCDGDDQPYARALFTPAQFAEIVRDVEKQLGHRLPDGMPGGRHG